VDVLTEVGLGGHLDDNTLQVGGGSSRATGAFFVGLHFEAFFKECQFARGDLWRTGGRWGNGEWLLRWAFSGFSMP